MTTNKTPIPEKYAKVISFNFANLSNELINYFPTLNTCAYFENKTTLFDIMIIEVVKRHVSLRIKTNNALIKETIEKYNLPPLYSYNEAENKILFVYSNEDDDIKAIQLFEDLFTHANNANDQTCINQINEIIKRIKELRLDPPNYSETGCMTLVISAPKQEETISPLQRSLAESYVC